MEWMLIVSALTSFEDPSQTEIIRMGTKEHHICIEIGELFLNANESVPKLDIDVECVKYNDKST